MGEGGMVQVSTFVAGGNHLIEEFLLFLSLTSLLLVFNIHTILFLFFAFSLWHLAFRKQEELSVRNIVDTPRFSHNEETSDSFTPGLNSSFLNRK